MPGGGEAGQVQPGPGDDGVRGGQADPRHLIELAHRCSERRDLLLDPRIEGGDIVGDRIHPGRALAQHKGVVIGEVANERLIQHGDLLAQLNWWPSGA